MNRQEILALYDAEMRLDPPVYAREEVVHQPGLTLCRVSSRGPFGGWILYTHLADDQADSVIQAIVDDMIKDGRHLEWKVFGHDRPADLKDRLLAHGFEAEEQEALVVLDLERAPDRLWHPVTADIRQITNPAGVDSVMQVQAKVWDEVHAGLADELKEDLQTRPDRLSVYLAYVGNQAASSAWIRFHPGRQFADLWGGSTLPQFRRQGLYTALVAIRAQEARDRGVRFLTVDASPMSQPILEKLGFQLLTYTQPFVWSGDFSG